MTAPDTRDSVELLPCPFCGSDQVSQSEGETGDGQPWPYIECESCAATAMPDYWNRRALPQQAGGEDALQAEVARLRKEVELRQRAVDRWVPCPDHRDKTNGQCYVCRAEAAEAALREAQANDRRYRWLRKNIWWSPAGSGEVLWVTYLHMLEPPTSDAEMSEDSTAQSLDAAIDAAIGGTGDA